ncbi:hypothetical protein D9M69_509960 [compost metagenome]
MTRELLRETRSDNMQNKELTELNPPSLSSGFAFCQEFVESDNFQKNAYHALLRGRNEYIIS